MGAILKVVAVVRIVLGSVFLLAAGLLALLGDGLGRLGWLVVGSAAPRPEPSAEPERDLKLRAHAVSV